MPCGLYQGPPLAVVPLEAPCRLRRGSGEPAPPRYLIEAPRVAIVGSKTDNTPKILWAVGQMRGPIGYLPLPTWGPPGRGRILQNSGFMRSYGALRALQALWSCWALWVFHGPYGPVCSLGYKMPDWPFTKGPARPFLGSPWGNPWAGRSSKGPTRGPIVREGPWNTHRAPQGL